MADLLVVELEFDFGSELEILLLKSILKMNMVVGIVAVMLMVVMMMLVLSHIATVVVFGTVGVNMVVVLAVIVTVSD